MSGQTYSCSPKLRIVRIRVLTEVLVLNEQYFRGHIASELRIHIDKFQIVVFCSSSLIAGYVSLSTFFYLFQPQFLHLLNAANNSTYFVGVLQGLRIG